METFCLCLVAFLAGFVDSVVGGGGLIQLPALFIFLPKPLAASLPGVLGTNKLSSICGTGMAVLQYSRRVRIHWLSILPAGLAALVFSALGAHTVMSVKADVLKPLILCLLIAVAIYTYWPAVIYFAATHNIFYQFAIPMGLCNLLGSLAGSRLAILKGNSFLRLFFLVVVAAMILRFGRDMLVR